MCNLMKGGHEKQAFLEICSHIATYQQRGEFGLYPMRHEPDVSLLVLALCLAAVWMVQAIDALQVSRQHQQTIALELSHRQQDAHTQHRGSRTIWD
jgi:hypothetical protein